MDKLSVKDMEIAHHRVLVRADFNVPVDKNGQITSDTRIRTSLPTIKYLLERRASIVLCSHMGRPGGKRVDGLSLRGVAEHLSKLLNRRVKMAEDCVGPGVEEMAQNLKSGELLLLENLRFHIEEESNDDAFARALARLADIYVNDAFGTCHRVHASIVGVPRYLPGVAGLLLEKELKTLGSLLENPARPFGVILGGAKVSDKVVPLKNMIKKLDILLIGGAMAALFLKAKGYETGHTKIDPNELDIARALIEEFANNGTKLLVPVDVVVAESTEIYADMETVTVNDISAGMNIVDIGPRTMQAYQENLSNCRTIFWNGPMGIYEIPEFATGTKYIANFLANLEADTIIAGGSTAEVVEDLRLADKMKFVSTGGGASLEFLRGRILPGVAALHDKVPAKILVSA
jgi:3-phosphoglycerate kinase